MNFEVNQSEVLYHQYLSDEVLSHNEDRAVQRDALQKVRSQGLSDSKSNYWKRLKDLNTTDQILKLKQQFSAKMIQSRIKYLQEVAKSVAKIAKEEVKNLQKAFQKTLDQAKQKLKVLSRIIDGQNKEQAGNVVNPDAMKAFSLEEAMAAVDVASLAKDFEQNTDAARRSSIEQLGQEQVDQTSSMVKVLQKQKEMGLIKTVTMSVVKTVLQGASMMIDPTGITGQLACQAAQMAIEKLVEASFDSSIKKDGQNLDVISKQKNSTAQQLNSRERLFASVEAEAQKARQNAEELLLQVQNA
ncbi:MAG: hypothetical protein H7A33_01015 [Deltaproteobacteria bacterium]|nr:hypothetical protein [Deltaproteobacteria bacterium]